MKPANPKPHTIPTATIKVGERHRRDLGDIDAVAQNIAGIGLLHPIVTDPDGRLLGYGGLRHALLLPPYRKIEWNLVGMIAVLTGSFRAVRLFSIFERL
jgi:hypothetical protein